MQAQLLLLIGTNPLPAYVVACYFLQHEEVNKVWLLYSEAGPQQVSTRQQALQISACLKERFKGQILLHPIRDIRTAPSIQEDIRLLIPSLGNKTPVYFNYSGGTKPMALHVYRMLEQWVPTQVSFSYLDGRRFQLIHDVSGLAMHERPLRELVQLSFKELIALHQFELYTPYQRFVDPIFHPPLKQLQVLVNAGHLPAFWGTSKEHVGWSQIRNNMMQLTAGVNDINRVKYQKILRRNVKKHGDIVRENLAQWSPSLPFQAVVGSFPTTFFSPDFTFESWPVEQQVQFYNLIRFLDGQWLEMYVMQTLIQVFLELGLKAESCIGLELRKPHWETYFEIDIAALIGYQLLGISCTTYDVKSACKNKGFEIIHRVRQIGGDEIREALKMMLITCVNALNCQRLEQELSMATGTGRSGMLVCGIDDLPQERLRAKMKEFLS